MTNTIIQIYLDLDGVLADFNRGVHNIFSKRPDQLAPREMWMGLARHSDFFGTLEMIEDAHELWNYCKPHNPKILTGLPRGGWAEAQKRRWVASMLGGEVDVITCWSREKYKWSAQGHVLVDDRADLRERWEGRGGVFVLHTSAQESIRQLKLLGV